MIKYTSINESNPTKYSCFSFTLMLGVWLSIFSFRYFIGKSSSWQQSSSWITHIVPWMSYYGSAKRIGLETRMSLSRSPILHEKLTSNHLRYNTHVKIRKIQNYHNHCPSPLVLTVLRRDRRLLQPRQGRGRVEVGGWEW